MSLKLEKIANYPGPKGPVVLVIMDGVGIGKYEEGDFVRSANKPNLDWLLRELPPHHAQGPRHGRRHAVRRRHGQLRGRPQRHRLRPRLRPGRQPRRQGHRLRRPLRGRDLEGADRQRPGRTTPRSTSSACSPTATSTATSTTSRPCCAQAKEEGVKRVRVHPLLDGRDVPPTSALDYVDHFEEFLAELNADGAVDYAIASGGGRMKITMDRYEADWRMVERGWKTHVRGEGRAFASAARPHRGPPRRDPRRHRPGPAALRHRARRQARRPDRRRRQRHPLQLPRRPRHRDHPRLRGGRLQQVRPRPAPRRPLRRHDAVRRRRRHPEATTSSRRPRIDRTMGEYLADAGVRQLAISETQKFGHVTYFFNGNRSGKFDEALEDYVEIPSDRVPFEQRPWMKAAEITDKRHRGHRLRQVPVHPPQLSQRRHGRPHRHLPGRARSPSRPSTSASAACMPAVRKAGGILVVTADHGNADDMYEHDKDGAVKMRQGHRPAQGPHRPLPQPGPRRHLRPRQRRQGQADGHARPRHLLPRRHLPQPPRLPGPRRLRPLPRGNRRLSFPHYGNMFSIVWKISETFFHCVEKSFPHCGKFFHTVENFSPILDSIGLLN